MRRLIVSLLSLAMAAQAVSMEAVHEPQTMIESADVIALVDVAYREPHMNTQNDGRTVVAIQRSYKGAALATQLAIDHFSRFCSGAALTEGRYLVFLNSSGEELTPNNGYASVCPVRDDVVSWWLARSNMGRMRLIRLDDLERQYFLGFATSLWPKSNQSMKLTAESPAITFFDD